MTLSDFKTLLLTADPAATKWKGSGTGNYTVWYPISFPKLMANGAAAETVKRIQVDRFTKLDDDSVVSAIDAALAGHDEVAHDHIVDFEEDTGYIHHIFDCTVA